MKGNFSTKRDTPQGIKNYERIFKKKTEKEREEKILERLNEIHPANKQPIIDNPHTRAAKEARKNISNILIGK